MTPNDMDIYVRTNPHVHALQLTEGREDGWIAVVTDGNGQHIVSRAHVRQGLNYALSQYPTATAHPVLALTGEDRPLDLGDWIVGDGYGYEVVPHDKFLESFGKKAKEEPKTAGKKEDTMSSFKGEAAVVPKEEPKVEKTTPPPPKEVFITPRGKDGK